MTTKELILQLQKSIKLNPGFENQEIYCEHSKGLSTPKNIVKDLIPIVSNEQQLSRMSSLEEVIDNYDDWKKEDWKPSLIILL